MERLRESRLLNAWQNLHTRALAPQAEWILCTPQPDTVDIQLPIHGINRHFWGGVDNFVDYDADLGKASTLGFNLLRVAVYRMINAYHPQPPTTEERDHLATAVKNNFGTNIMPELFWGGLGEAVEEGSTWTDRPIEQWYAWIDFWLEAFPDAYCYDLLGEPNEGGTPEFFQKIRLAAEYLRSKTTHPITIGFVYRADKSINALVDLCDIVSWHFYPINASWAKQARALPLMSFLTTKWGYTEDTYGTLSEKLKWLASFNKPYLINEFGYAVDPDYGYLEKAQSCYYYNVLRTMKQHQDINFLGYCVFALYEPFQGSLWGLLRYDKSPRPALKYFP